SLAIERRPFEQAAAGDAGEHARLDGGRHAEHHRRTSCAGSHVTSPGAIEIRTSTTSIITPNGSQPHPTSLMARPPDTPRTTNTRQDRRRASRLMPMAAEAPTAAASVGVA